MRHGESDIHHRIPISKRLRFEVFKRDGFVCQYCGNSPPSVLLECDHVHPVALGGDTTADNLVTACQGCNRGKGAVPLSDVPQTLEARAEETLERESQIAGYEAIMRERRLRLDTDAQEVLEAFLSHFTGRDYITKRDFQSIRRFIENIGVSRTLDAAALAMARKPYTYSTCFRYFCGICWNKARKLGE